MGADAEDATAVEEDPVDVLGTLLDCEFEDWPALFRFPPRLFDLFRLSVDISSTAESKDDFGSVVVDVDDCCTFGFWFCCPLPRVCILLGFDDRDWIVALWSGFNTFPTAFVRPSRNTIRWPGFMYSGWLINRNLTIALSPVRRQSFDIVRMDAVWRMDPQWTIAWYREEIWNIL